MRFTVSTITSIVSFLAFCNLSDAITPVYSPYNSPLSKSSIFEQFDLGWKSRWIQTSNPNYTGEWEVEESVSLPAIRNDKGLVAKSEAAKHGISYKLNDEFFNNVNNTLVLQYEVKFQQSLNCGGAYIKLLNGDYNIENFSDETPYLIMFGPDKCGADNKVHFIIKILNPKTGIFEEYQLKKPPMAKIVQTTSLYTLIIEPNQDFQIRINGDIVRFGNLLNTEDFDILPSKEIVDLNDTKPENWIEIEEIDDPNDFKPDDWNEDEPFFIFDPSIEKPNDWNENEPEEIPDPNDIKPEDWDEDYDGEWEPKLIDNPNCENHGCGKWIRPKIKNPNYKGKWYPKKILNPEFKGEWKPKMILNPDYFELDKNPSDLENISGLGFEIWTMDKNFMFDNIYLGHSINEAEDIGNKTFIPKLQAEHDFIIAKETNTDSNLLDDKYLETAILSDMYEYTLDKIALFLSDLQYYIADVFNAPKTLTQRPGEALYFSSIIIGVFGTIIGFWTVIINLTTGMINSYFEQDKTAYVGSSKNTNQTKKRNGKSSSQKLESIKEKKGASDSKINETNAVKR